MLATNVCRCTPELSRLHLLVYFSFRFSHQQLLLVTFETAVHFEVLPPDSVNRLALSALTADHFTYSQPPSPSHIPSARWLRQYFNNLR